MRLFGRKKTTKSIEEEKKKLSGEKDKVDIGNGSGEKEEKISMKELYDATGKVKKSGRREKKDSKYGNAYKILIKPLVTEKVSNLGALNKYVFEVAVGVNKIEIAKAINEVYGIKPVKISIIKMAGKTAGYGRITGKRKNWKKAIVTLPAGESIKIYEGV